MASIISAGTTSGTSLNLSGDTSGVLQLASNGSTTAVTINTSQNTTFAQTINAPNTFGFKNRIINGAMVIDQRNAGGSVTITDVSNFTYTLDRWAAYGNIASKFSVQQNAGSVTPPSGFTSYLGATSLAATSVGTNDQYSVSQQIEGLNVADFEWGTANAKTVTLSFWVRSSLTGTFGGVFTNSALNRGYGYTYTINSANTWEQKSVTIPGDTSGTWLTTNGVGIRVYFGLGVGSTLSVSPGAWTAGSYRSATGATSVVGTNGATFYITGVQLEVGTAATSFDYRPYGTELALCQRYFSFVGYNIWSGNVSITGNYYATYAFKISMRTAPTVVYNGGGASNFATSGTLQNQVTTEEVSYYRVAAGTGTGYFIENMTFSAEL